MKTAEELYRKHRSDHIQSNIPLPMYFDSFQEALIEHDKEIISKIEEMIEFQEAYKATDTYKYNTPFTGIVNAKIKALTELKHLLVSVFTFE